MRDKENGIIRDVRIACLNLNTTAERMTVTQKLLEYSNQAYALAEAR